jgi:DNA-binding NarL/FixJ family response regulator
MRSLPGDGAATILVVDDDPSVRSFLKTILQRQGYGCVEAPNASEARLWLERHECDLMLCDIQMPGESGLELVRHMKTAHPDMAVIMVTVIDDLETAREALSLNTYGYLMKPVDGSQILISVANAMRRRALEMAQKTLLENLEEVVRVRTLDLQKANRSLKRREKELQDKALELQDMNSALKVLLMRVEADKRALEEQVLANVEKTIIPILDRLKKGRLGGSQRSDVELLETCVREIASPFVTALSSTYRNLTPQEIQVADLIKRGKSTKEIAATLGLSVNTVMSHRYKIRTKLGLKRQKQNLCSFLETLSNQWYSFTEIALIKPHPHPPNVCR